MSHPAIVECTWRIEIRFRAKGTQIDLLLDGVAPLVVKGATLTAGPVRRALLQSEAGGRVTCGLSKLDRLVEKRHRLDADLSNKVVLLYGRETFIVHDTIHWTVTHGSTEHSGWLLVLIEHVEVEARDTGLVLRPTLAQRWRHHVYLISLSLLI